MKLRERIENQDVMKVLLIVFIFIFVLMVFWIKILGATNVTIDVEKNGYCKQYGEDWINKRGENTCFNKLESAAPLHFSEQEFRNYCSKNQFLSTKFYSDCFKQSGSIV